jgi:hypothetical protein
MILTNEPILIDTWYVEHGDGTISPCQNLRTAEYLVKNGYAVRVLDMTRAVMSR